MPAFATKTPLCSYPHGVPYYSECNLAMGLSAFYSLSHSNLSQIRWSIKILSLHTTLQPNKTQDSIQMLHIHRETTPLGILHTFVSQCGHCYFPFHYYYYYYEALSSQQVPCPWSVSPKLPLIFYIYYFNTQ